MTDWGSGLLNLGATVGLSCLTNQENAEFCSNPVQLLLGKECRTGTVSLFDNRNFIHNLALEADTGLMTHDPQYCCSNASSLARFEHVFTVGKKKLPMPLLETFESLATASMLSATMNGTRPRGVHLHLHENPNADFPGSSKDAENIYAPRTINNKPRTPIEILISIAHELGHFQTPILTIEKNAPHSIGTLLREARAWGWARRFLETTPGWETLKSEIDAVESLALAAYSELVGKNS